MLVWTTENRVRYDRSALRYASDLTDAEWGLTVSLKRHILVDTQGLLMHALVHSAGVQDRDGGGWVMATLFGLYPFLLKLYADGGC